MEVNKEIRTLAFVDLETTGFKKPMKITELCVIACSVDNFMATDSGELPRVINKFAVCCNPGKPIEYGAAKLTGLSDASLVDAKLFQTTPLLEFLKHLPQPVCLIAHNGVKFDFVILREELDMSDIFWTTVKCCDSLAIFREIFNADGRKHILGEVYKRVFNREPDKSHEAEGDVKTLIKCAVGKKAQFMEFLLKHQKDF